MFVIVVSFKKPMDVLNQQLASHRAFLDTCYEKNYFIASGQNSLHTGGVIISQMSDRADLEEIIKQDPLYIYEIADYDFIEFTPTKSHPKIEKIIGKSSC